MSIFVTALQRTGSGGAGSRARLDFQLLSPNSPIAQSSIRQNGADLAVMTGADLTALAGMWFTLPMGPPLKLSVLAANAYGCSREQATAYVVP